MNEDRDRPREHGLAANDSGTAARLDKAVLSIARLIGRQIAREAFERLSANDNRQAPKADDDQEIR